MASQCERSTVEPDRDEPSRLSQRRSDRDVERHRPEQRRFDLRRALPGRRRDLVARSARRTHEPGHRLGYGGDAGRALHAESHRKRLVGQSRRARAHPGEDEPEFRDRQHTASSGSSRGKLVFRRTPDWLRGAGRNKPIRRVEYTVNSGAWKVVFPVDGIADSTEESFDFELDGYGDGGVYTLVVKLTDGLGNVGTAEAELR